jgi:hypothetical protein
LIKKKRGDDDDKSSLFSYALSLAYDEPPIVSYQYCYFAVSRPPLFFKISRFQLKCLLLTSNTANSDLNNSSCFFHVIQRELNKKQATNSFLGGTLAIFRAGIRDKEAFFGIEIEIENVPEEISFQPESNTEGLDDCFS